MQEHCLARVEKLAMQAWSSPPQNIIITLVVVKLTPISKEIARKSPISCLARVEKLAMQAWSSPPQNIIITIHHTRRGQINTNIKRNCTKITHPFRKLYFRVQPGSHLKFRKFHGCMCIHGDFEEAAMAATNRLN